MTLKGMIYAIQPRLAKVVQKQRRNRWNHKKIFLEGTAAKPISEGSSSDHVASEKENILSIYQEIAKQSVASDSSGDVGLRRPPVSLRDRILSVSSKNVEIRIDMLRKVLIHFPEDSWALVELGTTLAGKLRDYELSFICFAMAAERGSGVGTLCLGDQYLRGLGVAQDRALGGRLVARAKEVLKPEVSQPLRVSQDPTLGGRLVPEGIQVLKPHVGKTSQVAQERTLGGRLIARVKEIMQADIRPSPLPPVKPRIKPGRGSGIRSSGTPARHALEQPKKGIPEREGLRH
mmetsp:Transcript_1877/g.4401  ORF Transcript_1877/g.4401 Transcript_1877/m.4401 type:complete len:290 (+) Transcript_1877:446-1315(+)|eukprot:CAMPEP_0198307960 /NCGR_PEP_ID=MMETSP1450-20131203/757_1 /TAXON_ID=753684 ORGANISM="Madagascaria erythrocladiodes, Strain CCMP3234" /NCGR_SAMPLE_ID=MMETSP1450 /ASSEMBLY_ACC=CAM_ASM_001115 /LENGTH=289 /DNA_ID=CAMNT_0044010587 /DNA_START=432 /DNA_END=1301 /DNA_ORIENTATION=-